MSHENNLSVNQHFSLIKETIVRMLIRSDYEAFYEIQISFSCQAALAKAYLSTAKFRLEVKNPKTIFIQS